jgi:hypothetical protein
MSTEMSVKEMLALICKQADEKFFGVGVKCEYDAVPKGKYCSQGACQNMHCSKHPDFDDEVDGGVHHEEGKKDGTPTYDFKGVTVPMHKNDCY